MFLHLDYGCSDTHSFENVIQTLSLSVKGLCKKKKRCGICGGAEDNGGIRHSIGGLGVGGSRLDWSLRCCVVSVLLIVSDHNYPGWNRTITRAVHVGNWP